MSQTHPGKLAPRWLWCSGCVLAMMPFTVVGVRLAVGLADVLTVVALPLASLVFKHGLHTLVHGRCPPSSWRIALQLCGAALKLRER
jgi:hypothetical protein